jgi:hypothetical protein
VRKQFILAAPAIQPGLALACAGEVIAALWGMLQPSTVIVTKGFEDFQQKQQGIVWWFRVGPLLIAAGTALQAIGTLLS